MADTLLHRQSQEINLKSSICLNSIMLYLKISKPKYNIVCPYLREIISTLYPCKIFSNRWIYYRFKCKYNLKQYLSNKPTKCWSKYYLFCGSKGYCLKHNIYHNKVTKEYKLKRFCLEQEIDFEIKVLYLDQKFLYFSSLAGSIFIKESIEQEQWGRIKGL